MPSALEESQLSLLSPNTKPNCGDLLQDLRMALNRAAQIDLFSKMEFCHEARFPDCRTGHNAYTCRKPLLPGIRPWGGAADLEIRLVDQIIQEKIDLCVMASKRAQPHILPADLEMDDDDAVGKSELWGGVLEHYRELEEEQMAMATSELCGIGNEYGHGVMFVGWKEERRLVKKILSADDVNTLLGMTFGMEDGPEMRAQQLEMFDPDVQPQEALRAAKRMKPDEPCDYQASIIVRAAPDWRARTPGLDVFYPPETASIQKAPFIVETEWISDVDLRANVHTWREFDSKSVEEVLKICTPGRATFFSGLSTGVSTGSQFAWQLTNGLIGLSVGLTDMMGDKTMRQWQIITVRYKSSDPKTGIPVLYETTFHPDLPESPLSHKWSVDEHAQYPYVQYKRELSAPTLWASRGIGELSFSEQEEIRGQANLCFDSASMKAMPPYTASPRSNVANDGLRPGMRVDAIAGQPNAVAVLDVGGDMKESVEVQRMARMRAFDYFKVGQFEEMDPVAKQVNQQVAADTFLLAMRSAWRMTFAVIQQFAPDEIRMSCLHGLPVDIRVSREQILGNFKVFAEFEAADLDLKSVEAKVKAIGELVLPMDVEGMVNRRPLIQLAMMLISPSFGRQMMKSDQQAQDDEMEAAEANLMRNLNGLESKYREKGGNPQLRIQHTQQLLQQPAIDDKGNVVRDPATGRPQPGRAGQIYLSDPAAASLVDRTMQNEQMILDQQNNIQVGKTGVKPAATA